jgi:serine/threonine-protein kinase RsbW
LDFVFKSNAPGEKARLLAALENFARENQLPDNILRAADLAIEEHLTNILSYGFPKESEHLVWFDFSFREGELVVEVQDTGKAFDPTKQAPPDLKVRAADRRIGGLGIHMIRQSMDSLEYARIGDRNVLRMRKRVTKQFPEA